MPTSQNGYSANDRSVIASYTVPGTTLRIALRKGDASVVILEYLRRYHLEVESLYHSPQDLWGFAERTIRGSSSTLSNHASGTAADARAVRHPLGAVGTFTAPQLHALNRLLAYFEGALRHGKDYRSRKDEMHVEVDTGPAGLARIADKIRAGVKPTIPVIPPHPVEDSVAIRDDVWGAPIQDFYTPHATDTFPASAALGWAATHAAHARDAARDTHTRAARIEAATARLEQQLAALASRPGGATAGGGPLSDADVARIADQVAARLTPTLAALAPAVVTHLGRRLTTGPA